MATLRLFVLIAVSAWLLVAAQAQDNRRRIRKRPIRIEEPAASLQETGNSLPTTENISGLCSKKLCGPGRECRINANGNAECDCISSCPSETDPRRMVCSNYNETWNSDCELHRMRCLCKKRSPECDDEKNDHIHIEYYGPCQKIRECTPEEMVDFPRRMRDWLFNVMRDLAERKELSKHYEQMEQEAEKDLTRKWTNAAVWKFCELDGNPPDRRVSRHELFPIRAPLVALEHCISPFLDTCDANNDHFITLKEWGKCLDLDQSELENKCERVRG